MRCAALLCFLTNLLVAALAQRPRVAELIAFGDSLTDTGNAFRVARFNRTFPDARLYFNGRFTGAPGTWLDQVKNLSLAGRYLDFAFAGSNACQLSNSSDTRLDVLPSMIQQVDRYLAQPNRTTNSSKIIVLWGGHNDINSIAVGEVPLRLLRTVRRNISTCLTSMASRILRADPMAKVLTLALAPVERSPLLFDSRIVRSLFDINDQIRAGVNSLSRQFPGRAAFWDVSTLINSIADNPSRFNISIPAGTPRVRQSCLVFQFMSERFFRNITFGPATKCTDPNRFVYYDPLHYGPGVYKVMARELVNTLERINFIPRLNTTSRPTNTPRTGRRLI